MIIYITSSRHRLRQNPRGRAGISAKGRVWHFRYERHAR